MYKITSGCAHDARRVVPQNRRAMVGAVPGGAADSRGHPLDVGLYAIPGHLFNILRHERDG